MTYQRPWMCLRFQALLFCFIALLVDAYYGKQGDPSISDTEVEKACWKNRKVEEYHKDLECALIKEGKYIKYTDRVSDLCILRRRLTDPEVRRREMKQLPLLGVTDELAKKYNLNEDQVDEMLPNVPLTGEYCSKERDNCDEITARGIQCNRYTRYRTIDGTCNNLRNPAWGSSGNCFKRLLPARYVGSSEFRRSVSGDPLPPPRDLSLNVHQSLNVPTDYVTHMYMFFGQLLDHDISQAPISVTENNVPIECCPVSGISHPQCAPISVRADDPFYSQFRTRCLNFVRSAICATCTLGPRQQINQITTWIDASFIYGNSQNETQALRTNDGTGRLRVERSSFGDLLPSNPDPQNDQCSFLNTSDICFQSGDARTNQHPTLTSLHTLFVREHNRLANGLRRVNPQWNEETIFQEARKIVGAEMQVITYGEFLPPTLGQDRMSYFSLWISNGRWSSYDPTLDPTLYTEFSTAAFRFGHSLVNSMVARDLASANGSMPRLLRNEFFQPFELRNGNMGPILREVSRSSAQRFDRHLVPDITNFLYRVRGQPSGLDLASINIQRGRDHGLPIYTEMVRFCSQDQIIIRQFRDLVRNNIMTYGNVQLLQQNYRHVYDIDLWTGILSEIPNSGAVVGPTAACILGIQFKEMKFGDRFYFEHANQVGSFTYQQKLELEKISLSKLICLNTEVQRMPMNAMLFNSRSNPNIDCRNVRGVDLSYWGR